MGEQRMFPTREKHATGWQIGLSEQFGWEIGHKKSLDPIVIEEDRTSPEARRKQREKIRKRLLHKAQTVSTFKKESLFAVNNKVGKKTQSFNLSKLPLITKEVKQKYFGDASKQMFYKTYHDLREKGQILLGGFEELEEIIQKDPEDSVFLNPMSVMLKSSAEYDDDNYDEFDSDYEPKETNKSVESFNIRLADNYAISPQSKSFHDIGNSPDPRLKLYDDIAELAPTETTFNQGSPRAIFLSGCLKLGIPPLTASILRKKINSTMNLAHMGIGNYHLNVVLHGKISPVLSNR